MKIGMPELLVVLLIVLIVFGPSQLPKLTKMLGSSLKSFKDGVEGSEASDQKKEQN